MQDIKETTAESIIEKEITAETTSNKDTTKSSRNDRSSATSKVTQQNNNAKNTNTEKTKKAYIYLGPSLPNGILFTGNIFKKEISEHLSVTIEKLTEIKRLLVESREVPAFKKALEQQGSEAYRLYQLVEMRVKEGVLKQ